jgi:hypothetical protein
MPHPLQTRVEAVRRKALGLVRASGVAMLLIAAIVVATFFGMADYLLRLQDPGARWILSACAIAAVGWAAWKFVWPALCYRLGLVQVAKRIEASHPELAQRLSSAIDFLSQSESDKTAGSVDLRRAVVAEAEALAARVDLTKAIDRRRPLQRIALAGLLIAIVAGLTAWRPANSRLAISRLLMPWRSDLAWPRRHELAFVRAIDKLAVGDDLELELIDKHGRLPDNVQVQLRHQTPTGTRTETRQLKPLAERAVFRLDNVTQSLAYRASGGDDDTMPWTELAVIEPPKVVSLDIAVTPPAYTGLPRARAGRVAKVIAGSGLAIRGKVDKPIVTARLRSETKDVPLPDVAIDTSRLGFIVPADPKQPWLAQKSATYWIELADESGLPTGRDTRFELQSVADSPPAIAWETPADHTFVTPQALVPIRALVKDDLAIRHVELRYLRPGQSDAGEQIVVLFEGPEKAVPAGGMEAGDTRTIDLAWDLNQLAGLQPGDVLAIRLTAEDYQPQLATSVVRRLSIITPQELESRIGQRQSAVLSQLAEALRIERDCRQQIAGLIIRREETGKLTEGDLNLLQSAQLNQRQVESLLGSGPEGVEGQLAALLAELAANRVEGQAVAQRMNDLLAKVRLLNRGPLVEISQRLTETFKAVRARLDAGNSDASADDAAEVGPWLAAAGSQQDEVIAVLEGLLGTLKEWDSFSRLAREIGQIRTDQERIADETETLRLAGVAAESPAAEQRSAARQLAQRELELARRLDKIQGRMEEMLGRLQGTDPLAAGTLADALEAARRLAIGGHMRDAAGKLGQQQLGESRQAQATALDGLAQLLDVLSSRREDELARTIKALRAASGQLSGLQARQRAAGEALDAAAAEANADEQRRKLQRLTRELEQLAQEAEQLGRKLQRLTAPKAAQALGQAGGQDAAAGAAAGQGNAGEAQEQARQAERRLEDAQREIQQAIAQAEQELVQQELARMEQWIEGLLARQKNVVTEIARLDETRTAAGGQFTDAQQATLRGTAAEQRLVADETDQLRLKVEDQSAFAFALEGAGQDMRRAAGMMAHGQTDAAAQQAARDAATRLEQMLAALKPDDSPPPDAPPPDAPPPMSPPGGQQNPFSSLAALKLLQLLQGEINRRTQELETVRAREGKLTDEQTRLLDALATEQGRLAEMVLNMIQEVAPKPEDMIDPLGEMESNK